MSLEPPTKFFSTTFYDRYQPQRLSVIFVPTRSLPGGEPPNLDVLAPLLAPAARRRQEVSASYLPTALASLLSLPQGTPGVASDDPFQWLDSVPPGAALLPPNAVVWGITPASLGFAEHVSFSEAIPVEESGLKGTALITLAATTGAKIGLIAGGMTPFVLITVPAGMALCTAAVIFGPELGEKLSKLLG